MDLKYPQWQAPLAAAILEFDVQQLPGKLQQAEDAISKRIQELTSEKDNEHELRALTDGLFLIRGIKKRCSA
jgi:surfactin synthase thioesterase subunit